MIKIASRERGWAIASLICASIGQAGLAVLAAWCIQHVFDGILAGPGRAPADSFAGVAIIFAAAALGAGGLEIYRIWAGERLGTSYVGELRERLYARIINADPEAIRERRSGGLLLPFLGELTAIKKWVSDGLVRLISAIAMGLILLAALATRSLVLAGAAAALLVAFAGVLAWLSGPLTRAIREARLRRGNVANFVTSSLRAAPTIQAFDRLPREITRLRRRNDALMQANLRLARLTGTMSAVSHLTSLALIAIILAVALAETETGGLSAGAIAAAMSLAGLLAGVIRDLGVSVELGRRADAAFARITASLELPSLVRTSGSRRIRANARPGLELRGVALSGVVAGANALAHPGTITEVAGPGGSGKSALIAALAGLRAIDAGQILIDGRDISRAPTTWLRRRIGIAGPSVPLLRGTLGKNLRYRRPNATASEIESVIAACHLEPLLARLPQGLETRLSDGAPELTKGEIARVQIARAMLGAPEVLLLDEIDIFLDEPSLGIIANALRQYPGAVVMTANARPLQRLAQASWRLSDGELHCSTNPRMQDCPSLSAADAAGPT